MSYSQYPLVSILVNCYNSEKYILCCLYSLINQTYQNIEIIVWDNCSNDSTADKVNSIKDHRIKYFESDKFENLVNARISASKYLKGDFIAILDSDDVSYPYRIQEQINYFIKNENVGVLGGAVTYIDEIGNKLNDKFYEINQNNIKQNINYVFPFNNSTLMFRKLFFDKVGGYSPTYEFINDYHLVKKISNHAILANINVILSKNRIHNDNLSKKKFVKMQLELRQFLNLASKDIKFTKIKVKNFAEQYKCLFRIIRFYLIGK